MQVEFLCKVCHELKSRDLFPKGVTYIHKCKLCIAEQYRRQVPCKICQKLISYSNINKHIMFFHNRQNPHANNIACECGKVLKEYSLAYHRNTPKHISEIALLICQ